MRPLVLALGALLLAGCKPEEAPPAPPVRPVLSTVVEPVDAAGQTFVGEVDAQTKADLGFQTLGRLVARNVDIGDLVTAGEELARVDAAALEFSVRSAEATLASREAELSNAEASLSRQTTLHESGIAPDANLEQAQQARDTAIAAVAKAKTDLDKAREQLGYSVLKADFDGVVTATAVDVGQVVAAGQTVITIARPDRRDAVIDIPDWIDFSAYAVGTRASVSLQVRPSIKVAGTVREIAPQSDAATRSRRVRVTLEAPPAAFRLGATVNVAFNPQAGASALLVPASAILDADGKTFVWVVDDKAGTVARREVRLAAASGAAEAKVESGLKPGERVVTAGVHSLRDGQQVKVEGNGA